MKDARVTCPIKCKDKKTNRCRKTTCEKLSEALSIYPCPCPKERAGCDRTCDILKNWHDLNEWRDGVSESDFKSRESLPTDEQDDDNTTSQDVIDTLSEQEAERLEKTHERIERAIGFKGKPEEYKTVIVGKEKRYYRIIRTYDKDTGYRQYGELKRLPVRVRDAF